MLAQNLPENTLDESLSPDVVVNTLTTWIEGATSDVMTIIETNGLTDVLNDITDISADLMETVKTIQIMKKIKDIPSKLFMIKFEKYCKGLVNIPIQQREDFIRKAGKVEFNKTSALILNIINRIEEISKVDILLKIFEARVSAKIDDVTFRRWSLAVDRTLLHDLEYLHHNIQAGTITIDNISEESLLSTGWIIYVGLGWGTATTSSQQLYEYTSTAKEFCEVIFDTPHLEGMSGVGVISYQIT